MTKHYIYQTADTVMYDKLKQYAKENKMFLTDAERALWAILKSKSLGYKFRQQHIIGDYIADFVSLHYHLIIEVDGKYHFKGDQPINDQLRTNDLNRMGFQVLRVTNEEVLHAPFQVINKIKQAIMNIESRSRPSKKAEIAKLEGQINPENNAVSSVSPPFGGAGGGFSSWVGWCSGEAPYIRSGTSIPSNSMPFLITFATFWASTRRVIRSFSASVLRIL